MSKVATDRYWSSVRRFSITVANRHRFGPDQPGTAGGFPLTLELVKTKLPKKSWVKISQIRVLAVERLGTRIARTHPDELTQVIEGLNKIVGEV